MQPPAEVNRQPQKKLRAAVLLGDVQGVFDLVFRDDVDPGWRDSHLLVEAIRRAQYKQWFGDVALCLVMSGRVKITDECINVQYSVIGCSDRIVALLEELSCEFDAWNSTKRPSRAMLRMAIRVNSLNWIVAKTAAGPLCNSETHICPDLSDLIAVLEVETRGKGKGGEEARWNRKIFKHLLGHVRATYRHCLNNDTLKKDEEQLSWFLLAQKVINNTSAVYAWSQQEQLKEVLPILELVDDVSRGNNALLNCGYMGDALRVNLFMTSANVRAGYVSSFVYQRLLNYYGNDTLQLLFDNAPTRERLCDALHESQRLN